MIEAFKSQQNFQAKNERQDVIDWLITNYYPPLPVAPAQEPRKYHKKARDKNTGYEFCPLNKDLKPIPLYTGKNPSYLDYKGIPHLVKHEHYHKRLPNSEEIKEWFTNSANGIGTLGGLNETIWLDLDVKHFDSIEECDRAFNSLLALHPQLKNTWIEQTHSGGYRLALRPKQKPAFTNFALQPGGLHVGEALGDGRFAVLAPTIGTSGNQYKALKRNVAVEVESLESVGIYPTKSIEVVKERLQTKQKSSNFQPGLIPLEMLGSDLSRQILNGESPTNDRSEALTTAIREWQGWINWCHANDINVSGTMDALAYHAGDRLGIDPDRIDRIIKTIALSDCHPAAIYKGDEESCWLKIHRIDKATFNAKCPPVIKAATETRWKQKTELEKNKVINHPAYNPPSSDELLNQIDKLIYQGLQRSQIEIQLNELAKSANIQSGELWKLYKDRLAEIERIDTRETTKQELDNLLKWQYYQICLDDFLPKDLANSLTQIADLLGSTPLAMLTVLLPTVATLINPDTQIELIKATEFYAKPIIYAAIAGESGSSKTPTMKTILKPLYRLQHEADCLYQEKLEEYHLALAQWKQTKEEQGEPPIKPVPREYYVNDTTAEAVSLIQTDQPDCGFLMAFDELSALLASTNAYRGGRGSDAEKILSGRDGTGIKVNRASGKRLANVRSTFSIFGLITPDILRQQMGDLNDSRGYWARFIWASLPILEAKFSDKDLAIDISDLLYRLYRNIESLPSQIYLLEDETKKLYKDWFETLEQKKLTEPNQALRAVYAKSKRTTGEIALLLHTIWAAFYEKLPEELVSSEIMRQAIALTNIYISQVKLIYSEAEVNNGELSPLLKKLIEVSQKRGKLSASWVKNNVRPFKGDKKTSTDDIRSLFRELESLGYGLTHGQGRSLSWSVDKLDKSRQKVDSIASDCLVNEKLAMSGFSEFKRQQVDKVDNQTTTSDEVEVNVLSTELVDNLSTLSIASPTVDENKSEQDSQPLDSVSADVYQMSTMSAARIEKYSHFPAGGTVVGVPTEGLEKIPVKNLGNSWEDFTSSDDEQPMFERGDRIIDLENEMEGSFLEIADGFAFYISHDGHMGYTSKENIKKAKLSPENLEKLDEEGINSDLWRSLP